MKNNEINGQPNRIEKSTVITGDIVSEADFRIDGTLEGSIKTSGKVVIGKEGVINGVIVCSYADIEGKFNGKLEVKESLCFESLSSQSRG
jgi:cytoskeletal protein CcmA (bactofilin family)